MADVDVRILEFEEYCFASTFFRQCDSPSLKPTARGEEWFANELRTLFWWHRFQVVSWLILNGVQIPAQLIADSNHPRPGQQCPDHAMVPPEQV